MPQVPDDQLFYEFPNIRVVKDSMQKAVDNKLSADQKKSEDENRVLTTQEKRDARKQANIETRRNLRISRKLEAGIEVKSDNFIPYRPTNEHSERG